MGWSFKKASIIFMLFEIAISVGVANFSFKEALEYKLIFALPEIILLGFWFRAGRKENWKKSHLVVLTALILLGFNFIETQLRMFFLA
tara:strand:- start:296 stop:559 length:264 start_codon:yes stop_codon:yes gene_type:complete